MLGRVLRVDHAKYQPGDGDAGADVKMDVDGGKNDEGDAKDGNRGAKSESEVERELLPEELDLAKLIREHDEEDPMKEFLVQEKREEVRLALERVRMGGAGKKEKKHRHRHHHREHGERDGRREGHREERVGPDRDIEKGEEDRQRCERPRSRRPQDEDRHRSRRYEGLDDRDRDRDDASYRRRKHRDDY